MMRKHLNHYASKLSASILSTDTSCTPTTLPDAPPAGYYYRMQLQDHPTDPTAFEIVDVTAVATDVTIARATESAAAWPARDWTVDASNDVWLVSVATAESFDQINGALLVQYREKTGTAATAAISMAGGPEQDYTMTGNTVITLPDMQDGQNLTLHIFGGDSGWSLTLPVAKKNFSSMPDLSGVAEAVFLFWKKGTQLYVSYMGSFA